MRELLEERQSPPWWLGPYAEPSPLLRVCLAAAIAAPSIHNSQPWLFHPHRHQAFVDVYVDRNRQLPVVDPDGREMLLSVGAALFNLKVAIRAHGRLPSQLIQPDPQLPNLAARIGSGSPATVPYTARALAWAIPRRRSNRWPFAPITPSRETLAALTTAARAEGATLRVLSDRKRRDIFDLVRLAEDQWSEDPVYLAELAAWTQERPDRHDGVPHAAVGPHVAPGGAPLRDLGRCGSGRAAGSGLRRRKQMRFEPSPTIAMLYADDSPQQWLRAGEALQRVLLTAQVFGLATTLMTQPLEVPRLRELAADPITGLPAQAIIRLGYSRQPAAASPRRPLADVLR